MLLVFALLQIQATVQFKLKLMKGTTRPRAKMIINGTRLMNAIFHSVMWLNAYMAGGFDERIIRTCFCVCVNILSTTPFASTYV